MYLQNQRNLSTRCSDSRDTTVSSRLHHTFGTTPPRAPPVPPACPRQAPRRRQTTPPRAPPGTPAGLHTRPGIPALLDQVLRRRRTHLHRGPLAPLSTSGGGRHEDPTPLSSPASQGDVYLLNTICLSKTKLSGLSTACVVTDAWRMFIREERLMRTMATALAGAKSDRSHSIVRGCCDSDGRGTGERPESSVNRGRNLRIWPEAFGNKLDCRGVQETQGVITIFFTQLFELVQKNETFDQTRKRKRGSDEVLEGRSRQKMV